MARAHALLSAVLASLGLGACVVDGTSPTEEPGALTEAQESFTLPPVALCNDWVAATSVLSTGSMSSNVLPNTRDLSIDAAGAVYFAARSNLPPSTFVARYASGAWSYLGTDIAGDLYVTHQYSPVSIALDPSGTLFGLTTNSTLSTLELRKYVSGTVPPGSTRWPLLTAGSTKTSDPWARPTTRPS